MFVFALPRQKEGGERRKNREVSLSEGSIKDIGLTFWLARRVFAIFLLRSDRMKTQVVFTMRMKRFLRLTRRFSITPA